MQTDTSANQGNQGYPSKDDVPVAPTTEASAATTSSGADRPLPELNFFATDAAGLKELNSYTAEPLSGDEKLVCCRVKPPSGDYEKRTASDICIVLDISGSMGCEAKVQGAESCGLTLLDVAKHGVRTVIETLGDDDRLSVCTFNHAAAKVCDLVKMDEAGKKKTTEDVDKLIQGGTTDISAGLQLGLEVLREGAAKGRLGHIMLLTDGVTNDKPKVMRELLAYKEKYERLPGTISTFGFGYNIDSPLINEVAAFGDGTYAFIPDAGFVGTCFVNTLSNLLVTMAREVYLRLDTEEGAKIIGKAMGNVPCEDVGEALRIRLGVVQYGQTKDVVVRLRMPADATEEPILLGTLQFETEDGDKQTSECVEVDAKTLKTEPKTVLPQALRCEFVERLELAMASAMSGGADGLATATKHMADVAEMMRTSEVKDEEYVEALLQDATGQSTEAVSRNDWFTKWGKHYIPSLVFAHRVQQCNNFKDPGVQKYGGKLFTAIQEKADDAFNTLPPPKPKPRASYGGGYPSASAAPVSMAAFNDRYGGCIAGDAIVELSNGDTREISELRKGDQVKAMNGKTSAEVVCMVRTTCSGSMPMVQLPSSANTRVTPYHPVHVDGEWKFPIELHDVVECECDAVYCLVLSGALAVDVGGVPCIALGHGIEEGAAKHAYYGSQRVLDDLRKMPGFESGLVELAQGSEVRDPETGVVCGLRY